MPTASRPAGQITPALVLSAVVLLLAVAGFVFLVGRYDEMKRGLDFLLRVYGDVRSTAIRPDGSRVVIKGMVLFRIPQNAPSTQPALDSYAELNSWLAREFGGFTRFAVETQLGTDSGVTPTTPAWLYFVGIEKGEARDVRQLVEAKLEQLFPNLKSRLLVAVRDAGPIEQQVER